MIISVLSFFIFNVRSNAVSLTNQQIPDINRLSDEQIRGYLQLAQSSGLSMAQLETIARSRGISEADIFKIRSRLLRLDSDATDEFPDLRESRLRSTSNISLVDDDLLSNNDLSKKKSVSKIFGMDMFNQSALFTSFGNTLNIPTPKNYTLGAGDELIIDIYGASEKTYRKEVSPEGQIIIEGIGPITVAGISVENARSRIFERLTSIYSGLEGRSPNTFTQITIGNIRTITVNVIGRVQRPGTYVLNSFSGIINALFLAGGPSEKGSFRSIRLIRNGEVAGVFDIYKYLFESSIYDSPILQDGDQIVVDPYTNRVSLTGAVKNSAKYELLKGENFRDLLNFSGGFEGNAYTEKISFQRYDGRMKLIVTISEAEFDSTFLLNGDSINVGTVIDRFSNRVSINGAIRRPGNYQLSEGMMLTNLIREAGGLREDAFKNRGNVFRENEDLTKKNISFDVKQVLIGYQDMLLQKEDSIYVPSIFDLREKLTIKIEGEVRFPGTYPFVGQMTVEDLINISGGFKESAYKAIVEVARQMSYDNGEIRQSAEIFTIKINEDLSLSEAVFKLKPFDVVLIKRSGFYQEQKLIRIEGEVLHPGFYALETREDKISDIVGRAGGLTEFAYPKGATILRRKEFYNVINDSLRIVNDDELEVNKYRSEVLRILQRNDSSITELNKSLEHLESVGIDLEKSLGSPGSKFDLILREGDIISVPGKFQTVRVRGNVLYPNTIPYDPAINFRQLISSSGGFADNANRVKSYAIYANGSAQRTKRFLFFKKYPAIEPGAEIIVPERIRKRNAINVQQFLGISSSLATIALIINQIRDTNRNN